jgi:hypothetical protein
LREESTATLVTSQFGQMVVSKDCPQSNPTFTCKYTRALFIQSIQSSGVASMQKQVGMEAICAENDFNVGQKSKLVGHIALFGRHNIGPTRREETQSVR